MSHPENFFSANYEEARARFLEASRREGGVHQSFVNDRARGRAEETLTCDAVWHGPEDAEAVLVTLSATHGAEGFCGSGVQLGTLESGEASELPEKTALLQIHAINPYGFSWLRRVTEDNVDLNRNFLRHGEEPYPENRGYEELHGILCPSEWTDAVIAATNRELMAYAERHGRLALQSAISGGQYEHSDGLFYGGREATWSNRTLIKILTGTLGGAQRVALIDYHTGLGPRGHGERICAAAPGGPGHARAEAFYDGDITSPFLGTSASVPLHGVNLTAIEAALPHCEVTAVALEYGTIPTEEVKLALRADNWLHQHGDPAGEKGKAIKQQIRAAFYQDAADWKEAVWERALETQRLALKGLWAG